MLKKIIFVAALGLGFVTSFHFGKTAGGGQASIRVNVPAKAAACGCNPEIRQFCCWYGDWGCC
jgi:hypothetical protein